MSKPSILIVDDDLGMTETMSDILVDMGYEVAVAGNGYKAIDMIKEKAYDIVLMDIKMPGINGVETFKKIKKIRPSTKVIMMTAYSVEDLIKEAVSEGAYSVLYKPLDIDKVVSLIEKVETGALILVVDDDPNTCETLKDILEHKDYIVGIAHSGDEALDKIKEKDYDIMFIDMKMPVLNGLETYLAIKDVSPEITAVMMTGYRQEVAELAKEAVSKSAYTCIYKPLEIDKVISLVEKISTQRENGKIKKPE